MSFKTLTRACKELKVERNTITGRFKDVSRNNTYHNKALKKSAESHGLIIERDKRIGWSYSSLSPKTMELVDTFCLDEEAFYLFRIDRLERIEGGEEDPEDQGETKPKKSSRRYVCPGCGAIIRSTKDSRVICGDCMVEFVKEGS